MMCCVIVFVFHERHWQNIVDCFVGGGGRYCEGVWWWELYREWIIDIDEDDEQGDVITVKYEDAVVEDLDPKYCVRAIKLYQDIENGVTDKWTIVNE